MNRPRFYQVLLLRRITLPRTPVNKGIKRRAEAATPQPSSARTECIATVCLVTKYVLELSLNWVLLVGSVGSPAARVSRRPARPPTHQSRLGEATGRSAPRWEREREEPRSP